MIVIFMVIIMINIAKIEIEQIKWNGVKKDVWSAI